jgi:hypothetical protein
MFTDRTLLFVFIEALLPSGTGKTVFTPDMEVRPYYAVAITYRINLPVSLLFEQGVATITNIFSPS